MKCLIKTDAVMTIGLFAVRQLWPLLQLMSLYIRGYNARYITELGKVLKIQM